MFPHTKTKQLERSKETHYVFVGNIDWNVSAAYSTVIAIKGKMQKTILLVASRDKPSEETRALAP
jgi:hypothetical protein